MRIPDFWEGAPTWLTAFALGMVLGMLVEVFFP